MKLIPALLRQRKGTMTIVVVTSIAAGAGSASLLGLINSALGGAAPPPSFLFVLLGAVVVTTLVRTVAQYLTDSLATSVVAERRTTLAERVASAPLEAVERFGGARFAGLSHDDIPSLGNFVSTLTRVTTSAATTVAALAYLAWLAPKLLALAIVGVAVGYGAAQLALLKLIRVVRARRAAFDRAQHLFELQVRGAKELRLNAVKQEAIMAGGLKPAIKAIRQLELSASLWNEVSLSATQLILFGALGAFATFGRTHLGSSSEVSWAFTVTSLYLMGSVQQVLALSPTAARARVALVKLDEAARDLAPSGERPHTSATALLEPWTELQLDEVGLRRADGDHIFQLGPIDLRFRRGSIVFIVGGNGSGKSTLGKIITGLYRPDGGSVSIGDTVIDDTNRAWYRQHFSTVLSDYCLIDEVPIPTWRLGEVEGYLKTLKLEGIVDLREGRFSTKSLSTGQTKRLALVVAYLEDRPIYVFDEWAADQDPGFRAFFYRRLLPDMKKRGKTVICISHDDAYFGVADQIVKLDAGRLASEGTAAFVARLNVVG